MIPPALMKIAAEKGLESSAFTPRVGDIPSFQDKIFRDVGSEASCGNKDLKIPKFAKDTEGEDAKSGNQTDVSANESSDLPFVRNCYVNADGIPKNLPRSDGSWTGDPGNSVWVPDPDYVPQKGNPEGKTWGEILDKYGIDGIPFNDGEPDFSEIAEAEVQVDEIGEDRDENFAKADEALAEQWTKDQKDGHDWTAENVRNYRKENHLTWHECGDRQTMQLVPAEVHSNVPHSGGVSIAKAESAEANVEQAKV